MIGYEISAETEVRRVGDHAICALSVEFHVQRVSNQYLNLYVFDAGSSKHGILPGLSLPTWRQRIGVAN